MTQKVLKESEMSSRKMEILIVPAANHLTIAPGSINSISYHLLSALSNYNETFFYAIVNNLDPNVKLNTNIRTFRVGSLVKPPSDFGFLNELMYPMRYFKCASTILRSEKVDIVHHMLPFVYGISYNPIFILKKTGKWKFVIGPAELPHLFFYDEFIILSRTKNKLNNLMYSLIFWLRKVEKSTYLRYMFSKTLDKSDILIAVNEATKKEYSKVMSDKKIRVIPLGVDLNEFKFSEPPLNHDILTVGLHIQRKGFDYLIKAMAKILKEYPEARLHIPSSGPRTDILKALAKDLGIESNVIFHGYLSRNELLELYKSCRVFCHPSLSEGFCHTTLEAMATGRPVVSTNTVGSEMVADKKTGLLVPPADSDALADAILKIFSDDEL
ncbi:MAG TPA: glycosyltransferase family 1 protein, partial [Thermoplasmatales archaeon]|nr:glycosyltransferase family 1 protein [Thermoplasmatales archaeon]